MNRPRRLALALVLPVLLLGAGCAQSAKPAPPSSVKQPSAVVTLGGHLFVASLSSDGLQVVDIVRGSTDYDTFLRAPNPMFPLVIPTLRRPTTLAKIDQTGDRPLVISGSSLDSQLRFVDGTALQAIGAPVPLPGRPLQLRIGADGTTIYALVAGADDGSTPPEVVTVTPTAAVLAPTGAVADTATVATVTSEVPVPGIDPGGLAITDASGSLEAWVSDLSSPQVVRVDLSSGAITSVDSGLALSELIASPVLDDPDAPAQLPAGAYVYGIAADSPALVAFDVAQGTVAHPLFYDGKVLPVTLPEVPVSMAAESMVQVSINTVIGPIKNQRTANVPILIMVPLVNGSIAYVDGYHMLPVDKDADLRANPTVTVIPAVNALNASGYATDAIDYSAPVVVTRPNPQYSPKDPLSKPSIPVVTTTAGVTRSRTWTIGWKAKLPQQDTVLGRLVAGGGQAYVVPLTPVPDLGDRVRAGDVLTITSWHGATVPSGCDAYTGGDPTYDIVAVDGALGHITLAPQANGDPLPTRACFSEPFVYSVTASGYTLSATDLSKVWRLTPGETFRWDGSRFLVTSPLYLGPDFVFTLASDNDPSKMSDGATRKLEVSSGLDPVIASVDTRSLQIVGAFVPGQPTVTPTGTGWRSGRLYVPYTASGAVISFDVGSRAAQELLR